MSSIRHSRLFRIAGLLLCVLVWLANNNNPPTGRTGAPFDGNCNSCHDGNNPGGFDGNVTIDGLPATIEPNTTYNLTLTMDPTAGSPGKGGFQLVVVDANNGDCGDLINLNAQTGTEMFMNREYIEQRGGKLFVGGNSINWDFQWISPATVPGNTVKFYYIGNFTNNNNGDSGDFPKAFNMSLPFGGPPPVSAVISSFTNVLCFGGNSGSATVEASGGVPPYTYAWSNGQTTATATNLSVGTYTVTVTGSSGSGTATASAVISQPAALTLNASVSGILTCVQTEITATATAGGGVAPYEYFWPGGQTGPTAVYTEPGAYNVTASDANGCTKVTTVTVQQNTAPPQAVAISNGDLTCTVQSVTLSGVGSSQGANFSYLWTTTNGNIVSGATSLNPLVNACGTYTLQVTNNINGCTATASTTVQCQVDPPALAVSNNGPLTCTVLNVTLNSTSNVQDLEYLWTGPNGFVSDLPNPNTNTPGAYTLVVTNPANSCTNSATTVVNQNVEAPTDTAQVSGVLTCANDSVRIFMTTNINNATFQWTGPNGFISNRRVDTIAVPGIYIGIVTNPANGCKTRDTITVEQDITPPGAVAGVSGAITCLNESVQLIGAPPGNNTYAWSGPNGFSANEQNPSTIQAGDYTLVVTSLGNGCASSASVTVVQNTTPPIADIAPPGNLNCNNPFIQLNGTGSSQGANFTYLWTTMDGQILSGEQTLLPEVGAAGSYTLMVTNTINGCTAEASVQVFESPALGVTTSGTAVSCNGGANGSVMAEAFGGTSPYTYLWSNGATTATVSGLTVGIYIVTITDSENCTISSPANVTEPDQLLASATATGETALGANDGTASAAATGGSPAYAYLWSNGATTAQITQLAPGSYTVSVTDNNGCSVVETVTVNAFGCNLSATIAATNISCNGAADGTASVILTGAADPVSYLWSTGATTQQVSALTPGVYSVSILDANNCPAVLTTVISEPSAISPNATATGETGSGANNGTAVANPTGGAGGYSYLWSTDQTSASINGLAPGTYTVTVFDANNCSATQSVVVSSFNCTVISTITGSDVSCFGRADGQATVVLNNGQLPYSYLWSNGSITSTALNLQAGTYTVTASDAAGCTVVESISIGEPDPWDIFVLDVQGVLCPNQQTGSISIDISGGAPPYVINGSLTNLSAGAYTVTIFDQNQCGTTLTFNIPSLDAEPPVLNCPANIYVCGADFVTYPAPTATDNCGLQGGVVRIAGQASGSVFNDGITTQIFRATDLSGNSATCSFNIVVYPIPDILFDGATNDQNGQGVGTISITAVGGGGGYLYAWNRNGQFFSNDEDLVGLNAGSYTLTITDMNGCTSALAPIVITNTVGVDQIDPASAIRLWPNPTQAAFSLTMEGIGATAAIIMDTKGRLVKTIDPEWLTAPIRVDELATGVYFLKLHLSSGQIATLRLVKTE